MLGYIDPMAPTLLRDGPFGREAEVIHISPHGFWMLLGTEELLVPFTEFPWFKKATVEQITQVERPTSNHLYWPLLDVDLFRRLFSLGAQARALQASGEFQALFASDVVSEPEAPAHAPLLENADGEPTPQPALSGDGVVLQAGLILINLAELIHAFEGRVILDGHFPRNAGSVGNVTSAQDAFLGILRHMGDIATEFRR